MTLLFYPKHLIVLLRKQKKYAVGEDFTFMRLKFYVTKHRRSRIHADFKFSNIVL